MIRRRCRRCRRYTPHYARGLCGVCYRHLWFTDRPALTAYPPIQPGWRNIRIKASLASEWSDEEETPLTEEAPC